MHLFCTMIHQCFEIEELRSKNAYICDNSEVFYSEQLCFFDFFHVKNVTFRPFVSLSEVLETTKATKSQFRKFYEVQCIFGEFVRKMMRSNNFWGNLCNRVHLTFLITWRLHVQKDLDGFHHFWSSVEWNIQITVSYWCHWLRAFVWFSQKNLKVMHESIGLSFSVEKNYRKENIQFSTRSFFLFPAIAHDAQSSSLQSRWCLV